MTRERYHRLIGEYTRLASERPRAFRWRVHFYVAAAFLYLVAVLLLLTAAITWSVVAIVSGEAEGWTFVVLVLAGLSLLAGLRGLFSRLAVPGGHRMSRAGAPALFEMIEALRSKMRVGKITAVWIDGGFNAAAAQRPIFGLVGMTRCHLSLGLPLMAALPRDEFRAVVAHELAHFEKGHGFWLRWIYRLHEAWVRVGQSGLAGLLLWPFDRVAGARFSGVISVLSRHQEFEADARAAQVAGRETMSAALVRTLVIDEQFERRFLPGLLREFETSTEPPADALTRAVSFVRGVEVTGSEARTSLRIEAGRAISADESHPSVIERVRALGSIRAAASEPTQVIEEAFALLRGQPRGDAFEELISDPQALIALGDREWRKEAAVNWEARQTEVQRMRGRLADLDERRQGEGEPLVEEEDWERVVLTLDLEGEEAGREALEDFLGRHPDHAQACMSCAIELHEDGDEACLEWADRAAKNDPTMQSSATQLRQQWLRETGRGEEAEAIDADLFVQQDAIDRAAIERASLQRGTRVEPHGLAEPVVERLAAQLRDQSGIDAAYLVKRALKHVPERPQYILAVQVRRAWWKWQENDHDNKIVFSILSEVGFPHDWLAVSLRLLPRRLRRRITRIEGAAILQ